VAGNVVVRAGEDANAVPMSIAGQALQHRNDVLAAGDVELPVGVHEIVLGVDIPE
jgi:hypothetical protein